jgi:hypothetical protein
MLNKLDFKQIKERGSDVTIVMQQIENFKNGFPFAILQRPATIDDGIILFSDKEVNELVSYYNNHSGNCNIIKLVPASGAASRMFQTLYNFMENATCPEKEYELLQMDQSFNSVFNFIRSIKDFAFYHDLKNVLLDNNISLENKLGKNEFSLIIDYLLNDKGLGYGKLPKGLLKFHSYESNARMAFEEHIVEAAAYGTSTNKVASIHFTVSPEHLDRFKSNAEKVQQEYEKQFGINLQISFSLQKTSTDTIAVDMDNNPFRENGALIFRPGGHGALIENLNELNADIIFIKNIDNIVPDRLKASTIQYKKAIGGLLLMLQTSAFGFMQELEKEITEERCNQIAEFCQKNLNINLTRDFYDFTKDKKKEFLLHYLNRPIRVCGMVKNEGEPGGGPFWVMNSKGEIGLQIVESSQVDTKNPEQDGILKSSTHFNPVDLVCGIKDYKGYPFDLHKFIDPETGFISIKSKDGKKLKAQELPGLWNGAMADWITIFSEVPISTFNPVKAINDLLRPQHQLK